MILDWHFAIAATLLIALLVPLYIYKDKIYTIVYRKNNFEDFVHRARLHLNENYPKITFRFDQILDNTKNEPNEKTRAILVAEDLLRQFIDYDYNPTSQPPIDSNLLWSTYRENCIPIKDKLPTDWSKRKNYIFQRDNNACKRCGVKLKLDDARVSLLKPIENGGQYNFENLQILCNDCYKIINITDKNNLPKTFNFLDELIEKIN